MKYLVMYLICGFFWTLWIYDYLLHDGDFIKGLDNTVSKTKKEIFIRSGADYDANTLKRLILGISFCIYCATWPWVLIKDFVIANIQEAIHKH